MNRLTFGLITSYFSGAFVWNHYNIDAQDQSTRIIATILGMIIGIGLYSIYCLCQTPSQHKVKAKHIPFYPFPVYFIYSLPVLLLIGPLVGFFSFLFATVCLVVTFLNRDLRSFQN